MGAPASSINATTTPGDGELGSLNPKRIGLVVGGVYLEMLDVDHALDFILRWNADMMIPVSDAHS
jgi:hypothetical protein